MKIWLSWAWALLTKIFRGESHRGWYTDKLYPMFVTNPQWCLDSWAFHPHVMLFLGYTPVASWSKFELLSPKVNITAGLNVRSSWWFSVFVDQDPFFLVELSLSFLAMSKCSWAKSHSLLTKTAMLPRDIIIQVGWIHKFVWTTKSSILIMFMFS